MLKIKYMLIGIIIIGLIISVICFYDPILNIDRPTSNINDCNKLKSNFDNQVFTDIISCDNTSPIWVGGTLTNITTINDTWYYRNTFTLTFSGQMTQKSIQTNDSINKQGSVPYKIGQFYKFDLKGFCPLRYSAASSGMFHDPDMNAFIAVPECN